MARLIINDGSGPQSHELSGKVVLGSNPHCDVVIDHPTTIGARIELLPKRFGYRAQVVKGELFVNERPADMADLEHNDTLRVGQVMLLYKQPEGDAFQPDADSVNQPWNRERDGEAEEIDLAAVARGEVASGGSSDEFEIEGLEEFDLGGDDVDELDELEELPAAGSVDVGDAVERARLKRFEALRRLQLADDGKGLGGLPDLSEAGALDKAARLTFDDLADLEMLGRKHGLKDATFREILDAAEALAPDAPADDLEIVELDELDELEPVAAPALDDAVERARLKRLEALRRLQLASAGQAVADLPGLSDAGALDEAAGLDAGAEQGLEALAADHGLHDATFREILDRAESLALRPSAPPPALDDAMERARLKRVAALQRLGLAHGGGERPDGEFDLSDADVLAEARECERRGEAVALLDLEQQLDLTEATPREILERAEAEWAAAAASAGELEELDELEEFEELEALDDVEELAPVAVAPVADAAAEELEELEELDELEDVEELEALDEVEELAELDEPAPVEPPTAEPIAAAEFEPELDEADFDLDVADEPVLEPAFAGGFDAAPEPVLAGAPVAAAAQLVATGDGSLPAGAPVGARPLPSEGIAFAMPLPVGAPAPAYLPPAHPGSPPA